MIAGLSGTYGVSATIQPLTKAYVVEHLPAILAIAADIPGEYWAEEHFLREVPDKWNLSLVAIFYEQPIAYAVASRVGPTTAHLHHLMVAKAYRRHGVGSRLLSMMMDHMRQQGYTVVTAKVPIVFSWGDFTEFFYIGRGFVVTGIDHRGHGHFLLQAAL